MFSFKYMSGHQKNFNFTIAAVQENFAGNSFFAKFVLVFYFRKCLSENLSVELSELLFVQFPILRIFLLKD